MIKGAKKLVTLFWVVVLVRFLYQVDSRNFTDGVFNLFGL